jgi:alkanesulfonate monooxygenase SsuD/methylene tetrahydromethanopterin reductase-like flavin-dependent oxidoreductase (luciferase family)
VRLNLMLEPQIGMTYEDQLAVARRAEAVGLDALYRSDHYSSGATGDDGVGSTDAWAVLAGLVRETSTLRMGTLVTPATFRTVGNLAKTVTTVNEMAGVGADGRSRIDLGMGTGWMEIEHQRHGFDFGTIDERFRRLEEHLEVLTRFWDADAQPFDYQGSFVQTSGSRFYPVPDPRPRIVIGGAGLRRTPLLAARFADELNGVLLDLEQCRRQRAALDQACEAVGRDPKTVAYSLMTRGIVGADEQDFRRRAAANHERAGGRGTLDEWLAGIDPAWITGTVEQVREQLAALAEAGVEAVMLQHLQYADLDMLDVIAALRA